VGQGEKGRFFPLGPGSLLRVRRGRTEQAFPIASLQSLNLDTETA
jgi:hypothetical protein